MKTVVLVSQPEGSGGRAKWKRSTARGIFHVVCLMGSGELWSSSGQAVRQGKVKVKSRCSQGEAEKDR